MLNWRPLFRQAHGLRRSLQSRHRQLHVTTPRLQSYPPRGLAYFAKIRYRADGQHRSRLVGALIATLVFTNALTFSTTYDIIEDSELALGLLASVIYTQQVDISFDKVNFEDSKETLSYFKQLYQSFSRLPTEEVDFLFQELQRLMKLDGENNSEAEAHRIMRHAAEQVHLAFQELTQESIANTANFVLLVMREALEGLIELVQDTEDDDSETKYTFQLIRDHHSKKDPGSVLKDYETLG